MSNTMMAGIAWVSLGLHLLAGILAFRSTGSRQLIPLLNLVTALGVIVYWAQRWYGYLFRGISWYASDQLLPLYALGVCVLAGATLAGRAPAGAVNWVVLCVHTVVLAGAAVFLTFFRVKLF